MIVKYQLIQPDRQKSSLGNTGTNSDGAVGMIHVQENAVLQGVFFPSICISSSQYLEHSDHLHLLLLLFIYLLLLLLFIIIQEGKHIKWIAHTVSLILQTQSLVNQVSRSD